MTKLSLLHVFVWIIKKNIHYLNHRETIGVHHSFVLFSKLCMQDCDILDCILYGPNYHLRIEIDLVRISVWLKR